MPAIWRSEQKIRNNTDIFCMDDFIFSLNVVAPLFLLIAAGYAMRQFNFVSDRFLTEATRIVFKFMFPLMMFHNIRKIFHGDFSNASLLIFVGVTGVSIVILVSLCIVPLFVKGNGQRGSMIQGIYRSNLLIYGMPLATGMYGQDAAYFVAALLGIITPLYNIVAVILLSAFSETRAKRFSVKQMAADLARNPLIIGCVAGFLFGALRIDVPTAINKPIGDISEMAPLLALILMGGEFRFGKLNNNLWKVFSATAARLIIVPLAAMIIFIPMGFRAIELSVLLCLFATPTAVTSYIMAGNMGCDGELSGQIVVMTTAVSSISIFLFIFVLKIMGLLC